MTLAERWKKEGKTEVVINMLNENCEPSFIKKVTGVTISEIKKIQKQAQKKDH